MQQNQADIVIIAAAMFRGLARDEQPAPGALAVSGSYIVASGTEAEIAPYIGPHTKVYRFDENKLLMPGICDSHLHLSWTITAESGPQLRYVKSEQECVALAKAWLEEHPGSPWVVGQGWHHANWPGQQLPDKKLLSAAIPDVPVCLLDVDCHMIWVNQKALDEFGISKDTPDIEGGVIYRDANGEPTGFIEEGPCMDIFDMGRDANDSDPAVRRDNVYQTCRKFNSRGITSVMDAMDTPEHWLQTIDALRAEERFGLRLILTAYLNDNPQFLQQGRAYQARYPDVQELVSFFGFKVLLDGVAGVKTAWMTDGYADDPDNTGYPLQDPEIIRARVLQAEQAGYGAHFHACGTRAAEFALDVIEEASRLGYVKEQRNCVTHLDSMNDKEFARFNQLDVVASIQPDMLCPTPSYADNLYPRRLGAALMANSWAYRRIFDNAPVVSLSSDSPVTVANPMFGIFRATQRLHDDGTPEGGIHPEQKVSLSECLWAYTYGGAYQLGREHILGSLEAGKLADITVLDHNIFTVAPAQYRAIAAQLTLVDGKIVYEK